MLAARPGHNTEQQRSCFVVICCRVVTLTAAFALTVTTVTRGRGAEGEDIYTLAAQHRDTIRNSNAVVLGECTNEC